MGHAHSGHCPSTAPRWFRLLLWHQHCLKPATGCPSSLFRAWQVTDFGLSKLAEINAASISRLSTAYNPKLINARWLVGYCCVCSERQRWRVSLEAASHDRTHGKGGTQHLLPPAACRHLSWYW